MSIGSEESWFNIYKGLAPVLPQTTDLDLEQVLELYDKIRELDDMIFTLLLYIYRIVKYFFSNFLL